MKEYKDENKVWFDIDGFMEYMREEFPEPMQYHFTYDLLENTVRYFMELFDDNREFASFITGIVPEITDEEILKFCSK